MNDIRPALRTFLLADSTVAGIVGQGVYPVILPQGVLTDSVVYNRISNSGDYDMQGPSGLSSPRIQLDCYSQTVDGAATLARSVKSRVDGYSGLMDTIMVQGVFFESEHDEYDAEAQMYRVSHDYTVWHEEL